MDETTDEASEPITDTAYLSGSVAAPGLAPTIKVTSSDFTSGGPLPREALAFGSSESPAISWSGIPEQTKSIALMLEESASGNPPVSYWLIANIPPTEKGLPFMMPEGPNPGRPSGSVQGTTTSGHVGYIGPRPAPSGQEHEFHFQVFALDCSLPLAGGFSRLEMLAAMRGHVLAFGSLIGLARR